MDNNAAFRESHKPVRSFKWEIPKDEPPKSPRLTIPQAKEIAERSVALGLISFAKPMSDSQIKEKLSRAKMAR